MILTYLDDEGERVHVYDANRSVLRSTGAFSCVLNAIEYHIENSVLVEEMCKLVNNLIGNYDSEVWEDPWVRAYSLLLRSLQHHGSVLAISYLVVRALFPIVTAVRDRVDVLKGMTAMLTALPNHSNPNIIFWELRVINCLGVGSNTWSMLGKVGACGIVLHILHEYSEDAKIVEQGCWLLHSLATVEENSLRLGTECTYGFELLTALLKEHILTSAVVERICCAVNNFSFNNSFNATRFGESGILSLIVKCIKLHLDDADVAYWCSSAINNLVCNNSANLRIVGEISGCETIVEMLKRFLTHCAVAEQTCIVIQNLTFLDANKMKLLEYHAVEVLESALKVHGAVNNPARLNDQVVSNVGPEIVKALERLTGMIERSGDEKVCGIPIFSWFFGYP